MIGPAASWNEPLRRRRRAGDGDLVPRAARGPILIALTVLPAPSRSRSGHRWRDSAFGPRSWHRPESRTLTSLSAQPG